MGESRAFNVKVGVHQGSVLSPLLFIIMLEALSREFSEGLPMELLYADDLVLIAETKELLLEKVRKWKEGMEKKGLRVNAGKTKIMWYRLGMGQAEGFWKASMWCLQEGSWRQLNLLRGVSSVGSQKMQWHFQES